MRLIVIMLVVLNIILLYKYLLLKKNYESLIYNSAKHVAYAPDFILNDLGGKPFDLKKIFENSVYTLFIFFSPLDCQPCLEEKYLWRRIFEEGKINIIGIARHVNERELEDWAENSGLYFTILNDVEYKVTKSFGISKTPLKVLVDSSRKIILIDSVRITSVEQDAFVDRLYSIVYNKNRG